MNVLEQTGNGRVSAEPHANRVRVTFNRGLYPLDAIYGAAYVFIDRCYVYLDAPDEAHVEVVLQSRSSLEAEELNDLAGSFANELLTHAWRAEITEANRPILEAVAAQAMAGAMGTPELEDMDDLDEMDFSEETFEDPLGIAMSWEEKYGEGSGEDAFDAYISVGKL
ncbi:MAG: His-Xaa-Ser system protein HxsD, partial [Myxococcota bacterium]